MNTVISVKVDKVTKAQAQEVAKSVGLNLSSLINSYLRQVVATRRIELFAPEATSPELEKIIASIEAEVKAGKISEPSDSLEDFLSDLKKA